VRSLIQESLLPARRAHVQRCARVVEAKLLDVVLLGFEQNGARHAYAAQVVAERCRKSLGFAADDIDG